jgi:hypothetical protein
MLCAGYQEREDEFKKMKKLIEGKSSAKACETQRKFYCPASIALGMCRDRVTMCPLFRGAKVHI